MSRGIGRESESLDYKGRPKKSISFRITEDQWHLLRDISRKDGAKMYAWAKAAVLAAMQDVMPKGLDVDLDAPEPIPQHLKTPVKFEPYHAQPNKNDTTSHDGVQIACKIGGRLILLKNDEGRLCRALYQGADEEPKEILVFNLLSDAIPIISAIANANNYEEAAIYGLAFDFISKQKGD